MIQTSCYAENQVAGATIATVVATDDKAVTGYEIKSGDTAGFYAIDATGKITLTAAGAAAGTAVNDFETGLNSFTLGVVAKDAAGNVSAAADVVLKVTDVDDTGPKLVGSSASGTTVKLNFDEAFKAGLTVANPSSVFTVTQGTTSYSVNTVVISGNTVTLTLAAALAAGDVLVGYTGTTLTDPLGNKVDTIAPTKVTSTDIVAPTLTSSSPADESITFGKSANIVLTFSETVQAGVGDITIVNTVDNTTTVINVKDTTQVTVSGTTITVNPTADLVVGGKYAIKVGSTAVLDAAGNAYAGIADNTTLNFTVAADAVVPTSGQTFTLTTAVDNIPGLLGSLGTNVTTGNDSIAGLSGLTAAAATDTLTVTDVIDGGAGTDTLTITATGTNTDVTHGALISNVEIVNVRNVAATTVDAAYAAGVGVTEVNSYLSTGDVSITNLATGAKVGSVGNANVINGALSATYATTATGAATLNLSGGTKLAAGTTGNVALIGAATDSTVINSTGAANKIGTVTNAATSKSITINATTGLETGAWATGTDTKLTVTGGASVGVTQTAANNGTTGAVKLGALTAAITTIDAAAMTAGGVEAAMVAAVTSFKGGQGTDVISTVALTSTTASIIDAGVGTDTLVVVAAADVATAAKAKQWANFENLDATTQAVDMSLLTNSAITGVMVGSSAAAITNLTATQAGNVTVYGTATTPTFDVVNASINGNLDTLKLTFSDGLTAKSTLGMGAFIAAGVETINIVATDHVTMTSLVGATALTLMNVSGAGDVSISTAAAAINPNTVIDASAVTGTVSLIATGATANGLTLKGSLTKANILTGSAQADILVGGAANDTITGAAGANIMTGGGGADSFVVVASGVIPSSSSFHTITDFSKTAGTTTFDTISAAALILSTQTAAAGSGVATLTAGVATFNAADTTFAQHLAAVAAAQQAVAGATTIWQEGADSYIYISDGTLAVATTDILIKLTGVTAGALTVAANAITAMA